MKKPKISFKTTKENKTLDYFIKKIEKEAVKESK